MEFISDIIHMTQGELLMKYWLFYLLDIIGCAVLFMVYQSISK